MNLFFPVPNRSRRWKCPKCGKEIITKPNPWIHIHVPIFIRCRPACPECGTKMIEMKLFY